MLDGVFEAEESLFQSDVHSCLEVVTFALKYWVFKLYHFNVDVTWPDVKVFVTGILVGNYMAVFGPFLHPDHKAVHAVGQGLTLAQVAD